ncbi:MAG: FAD-dependent oxidoreductase [Dehalococcoidia bacterium]|nr:FAD-dependent oxidoreductase [Dehalococcoidia bacterium]
MKLQRTLFPKLFEPINIGKMTLRNRIVMPAMATALANRDSEVTQAQEDYYAARAKGGAGLIIVESGFISPPEGRSVPIQMSVDDDRFLPGMSRLAAAIKKHDARAGIQLHHAGPSSHATEDDVQPVGPSTIGKPGARPPRELGHEEIAQITDSFARAAERARRAGFDGVEIMAARGYLLGAFISGYFNRREDEYGGTVEKRARFLVEVIRAIRDRIGRDYPVWCRIDGRDFNIERGVTTEQSRVTARLAQEAGADAISVFGGDFRNAHVMAWRVGNELLPPSGHPPGFLLPFAAEVKKGVTIPVLGVGRITPEIAESNLQSGAVDLIGMGRALIADPDLPNKVREGRLEDIIPCVACLVCRDQALTGAGIRCTVNPATGRERQFILTPALTPKKVMVVGGGPGGMQAAVTAAQRGHRVTLYEAEEEMGGTLRLACLPPYKEVLRELTKSLVFRVKKQEVQVRLSTKVTAELVRAEQPDVVVLATGSTPIVPKIDGIQNRKVVLASDVLTGSARVGRNVVVIGGGLVGCETAEFLRKRGHATTIIDILPEIAAGVGPSSRSLLLERLSFEGIVAMAGVGCEQINAEGVVICDKTGQKRVLKVDSVVLAVGARVDRELFQALEGKVSELHQVGDCSQPGRIVDATDSGARIGMAI